MQRELTCIVCPLGCTIEVEMEKGQVVSVKGNTCKRGKAYAESECTCPTRIVTTTVRVQNGEVLSVKTASPIPKEKVKEAVKIINSTVALLPISVGDVIIKDVFGSPVIATRSMK